MICQKCGGETRVVFTEKFDLCVKRVRYCTVCGYSITSWEQYQNEGTYAAINGLGQDQPKVDGRPDDNKGECKPADNDIDRPVKRPIITDLAKAKSRSINRSNKRTGISNSGGSGDHMGYARACRGNDS